MKLSDLSCGSRVVQQHCFGQFYCVAYLHLLDLSQVFEKFSLHRAQLSWYPHSEFEFVIASWAAVEICHPKLRKT